VRALARQLKVELEMVTPSGADGVITTADVHRVAKILAEVGPAETLRGVRRAMAQNMALAQSEVAAATVIDDADIHAWAPDADITIRLIRALVAGCRAEPALNAWYESHTMGRRLVSRIDVGIALDLPEGLFVPVLRDVAARDAADLRAGLERMRADVAARKIPAEAGGAPGAPAQPLLRPSRGHRRRGCTLPEGGDRGPAAGGLMHSPAGFGRLPL